MYLRIPTVCWLDSKAVLDFEGAALCECQHVTFNGGAAAEPGCRRAIPILRVPYHDAEDAKVLSRENDAGVAVTLFDGRPVLHLSCDIVCADARLKPPTLAVLDWGLWRVASPFLQDLFDGPNASFRGGLRAGLGGRERNYGQ